jgi:hypothetical protein
MYHCTAASLQMHEAERQTCYQDLSEEVYTSIKEKSSRWLLFSFIASVF